MKHPLKSLDGFCVLSSSRLGELKVGSGLCTCSSPGQQVAGTWIFLLVSLSGASQLWQGYWISPVDSGERVGEMTLFQSHLGNLR